MSSLQFVDVEVSEAPMEVPFLNRKLTGTAPPKIEPDRFACLRRSKPENWVYKRRNALGIITWVLGDANTTFTMFQFYYIKKHQKSQLSHP
jgi:hypothetical protein